MRGTWDDVNRRLVGAMLALDLHDALVVVDAQPPPKPLFRKRPERRRHVQVTAGQTVLVAECWPSTEAQEQELTRRGWEPPWQEGSTALFREAPLSGAPKLALAMVRALQTLGCEVADVDVQLTREEPDS